MYLGRSIVYSVKLSSEMFQRHVRMFSESVISFYPSRDVMYNMGLWSGYRWKSQQDRELFDIPDKILTRFLVVYALN
jgi:hypothetical protein